LNCIPSGDFRWHLGLRPGDPAAFFAPTAEHIPLLAERAHWLAESPEEYAGLTKRGPDFLAEAANLARTWGAKVTDDSLISLARVWEPDFVLLSCGATGLTVEGGAVCFPTAWSLREKMGRSLFATHDPVPGLNAELATSIDTALRKLPPGTAWERSNWGLAGSPDLNRHPLRALPALTADTLLDRIWFRGERQILFKLPQTGGILFGIRIVTHPLVELLAAPIERAALQRQLASMSEDAAHYKGLTAIRPPLLRWIAEFPS
jgi:hypothetical protein